MFRAITALSALFAVLLFAAPPALAHGGKIKLEVAGDGATGVTVRALYQADGHPVEDKVLNLALTATGEGGKTVGPLQLKPAPEGRAFYSSGAVLTPGRWTVVISDPDPNVVRAESTVDARAPQAAPAATAATTPPGASEPDSGDPGDSGGGLGWTLAFVVALALAGAALVLVQRRATSSRRNSARPGPRQTSRPRRHQ